MLNEGMAAQFYGALYRCVRNMVVLVPVSVGASVSTHIFSCVKERLCKCMAGQVSIRYMDMTHMCLFACVCMCQCFLHLGVGWDG